MIKYTTGIVQFDVITGEPEINLTTVFQGIETLAEKGARLAILPEMFSCSFDNENLPKYSSQTPGILDRLLTVSQKQRILIAGSLPEEEEGQIFNTLFLIEPSGKIHRYRKIHLFSLTGEHLFYTRGTRPVVCETEIGKIGMMICYDLRFPELCRRLTDLGAEMVIVSAQWPLVRVEHWETLLRARAIENQIFIAAANRCGRGDGLDFPGHSRIISPWGKILSEAGADESVIYAETDPEELDQARATIPCLEERVFDAYE